MSFRLDDDDEIPERKNRIIEDLTSVVSLSAVQCMQ